MSPDLKHEELTSCTPPFLKTRLSIIFLLLAVAAVFELIPFVKQARYAIPAEVFVEPEKYDCQYISNSRPWYSRFNYWFFTWILITPLLVSFIRPDMERWKKIVLSLFAAGICYLFMVACVVLEWDITNTPFMRLEKAPLMGGMTCYTTNDTGPFMTVFLGWIPAALYVMLLLLIKWVLSKALRSFRGKS